MYWAWLKVLFVFGMSLHRLQLYDMIFKPKIALLVDQSSFLNNSVMWWPSWVNHTRSIMELMKNWEPIIISAENGSEDGSFQTGSCIISRSIKDTDNQLSDMPSFSRSPASENVQTLTLSEAARHRKHTIATVTVYNLYSFYGVWSQRRLHGVDIGIQSNEAGDPLYDRIRDITSGLTAAKLPVSPR